VSTHTAQQGAEQLSAVGCCWRSAVVSIRLPQLTAVLLSVLSSAAAQHEHALALAWCLHVGHQAAGQALHTSQHRDSTGKQRQKVGLWLWRRGALLRLPSFQYGHGELTGAAGCPDQVLLGA
jgi:hypothetical protein